MGYKMKFSGFGNSPLKKTDDPVDKNWTGNEESGSEEELKAFKKDRNEALKKGKFKEAINIQKDVKSSKKAIKKKKKIAKLSSKLKDDGSKKDNKRYNKLRNLTEGNEVKDKDIK